MTAYHRAVQNLVLGAMIVVFVILAIAGAAAVLDRRGRVTPLQVALGIGVGLVGALLVLVSRVDLIPDGPEDTIERLAIIALTVAAVLGTWYRIARA